MIKRKIIVLISLIFALSISFTFAAEQKDWRNVESCRVLSSHLKWMVWNEEVQEKNVIVVKDNPFIDDWEIKSTSRTYFYDYQLSTNSLTLIKGPKDPLWNTVNFDASKIIWTIKLPKDFRNVNVLFYKEETMIVVAEHYDSDSRWETVAMFYDLAEDKLTATNYFANTWKIIKIHIENWKLYIVTNSELTKSKAQNFIKKDWDLPTIFPKFSEGLKYWLITNEKYSVCKNYKYLYKPSNQMPTFWNILVFNLNNINNTKDFLYYIWTLWQFAFSEKSMYLTIPSDNDTTIIQKFWLDPKLNVQSSYILSWTVLNGWIITNELKSAFVSVQTSWKLKVYTLNRFDENFDLIDSTDIYSWMDEIFDWVEYRGTTIFLKNDEKAIAVAEWNRDDFFAHTPLSLEIGSKKYFMVSWDPLVLLSVEERNNKLYFSLMEKDIPQEEFRNLYTASYKAEWKFLWNFAWNRDSQTLAFSANLQDSEQEFSWIRVLRIPSSWKLKEVMSRRYNEPSFLLLENYQEFVASVTNTLVDVFIPENAMLMKVLSK